MYTKRPIKECHDKTGKDPIGTRWVDINKGDEKNPEYRSRLVAQELNQSKRDDMFAATPPLEVLRLVISILASTRKQKKWKLDSVDIKRAYFMLPQNETFMSDFLQKTNQKECAESLLKLCMGPEMLLPIGSKHTPNL